MNEQANRSRIFDFFLLLLAFFSVVGLVQRLGSFGVDAKEAVSDFPVELLWEAVDARTADCLVDGEILRLENGTAFGTVKEILHTPHEAVIYEEGKEFRKTYPAGTVEDVRLTVTISGRRSNGILLREDGTAVLAGQTITLYSQRAKLVLRVKAT